jgi:hypothetical protein
MLKQLPYTVPLDIIASVKGLYHEDSKTTINEPTGRFFYDPWSIKEEYKGTPWETILATLPFAIGEARIIVLSPGTCYQSHADVDDRYHLNIQSEMCYMIDFDDNEMHLVKDDGIWYTMNTGRLHSAANFGRLYRAQLVVRKLLDDVKLTDPVAVKLVSEGLSKDDARFIFDRDVSPWLNFANKENVISDFKFATNQITFNVERNYLNELRSTLVKEFKLEIV